MTDRTRKTCDIEGCDKPARSGSAQLCAMHYHRVYRNGTTERKATPPKWQDLRGQKFGPLTVLERDGNMWACSCDCGNTTTVRTGDLTRGPLSCGTRGCKQPPVPRKPRAGYRAAHTRISKDNGPARQHQCIDCGRPAQQWSYDHQDPEELISTERVSLGMPYSLKTEHYHPRCIHCHKAFDKLAA